MSKVCPKCQKENQPSAKFCENCGTKLLSVNSTRSDKKKTPNGLKIWWEKRDNKGKALTIGLVCCIGLLFIVGISGIFSPDKTTTTTTNYPSTDVIHPEAKNVVVVSSQPRRDSIGNYIIDGEVQNNNDFGVAYVQVNATGYDDQGNVIAKHTTYADTTDLDAGAKSKFMLYLDDPGSKITRYDIQVYNADKSLYKYSSTSSSSSSSSSSSVSGVQISVDYSGKWQGSYGDASGSQSVDGSGSQTFSISGSPNIVSAVFQKMDSGSGTLTVKIIENGVVKETKSTSAQYGVVSVASSV